MFKNLLAELKELKTKKNEGLKGFLIRFSIFISAFSLIAGIYPYYKGYLNQPFYSTNGGFYKFLLFFIIIIFLIAHKSKIENSYPYKNKKIESLFYALLAIILYSTPFTLLSQNLNIQPIIANYLLFSLATGAMALSIFNSIFLLKYLQEECLKLILIIIAFFSAPIIFQNLWVIIFAPIKLGINIISTIINGTSIISTMTHEVGFLINIKDFHVGVGPACSGIQSIIAFTILFTSALIFLKKDKSINIKSVIKTYIIGILILYSMNIIRIIILIYTGAYISEKLAINLFHEYLSSLIFLFYFMYFIKKSSGKLFKKEEQI